MKKIFVLSFLVCSLLTVQGLRAEDAPAPSSSPATETVSAPEPAADSLATAGVIPVAPTAPSAPIVPMPTSAPSVTTVTTEAPPSGGAAGIVAAKTTDNLEFVSGEVTAMDEAAKTISVKLYGETENNANDKILVIKLDETTDITDGEKDRDIKSLTNGTEVDVEYDPATNKATYIFVY